MKHLGSALGFWRLIREISVEEIQHTAELGFTILVTGPSSADCDLLVSRLSGMSRQFAIPNRTFRQIAWPVPPDQMGSLKGIDLIVFVAGRSDEIPEGDLEAIRRSAKGLTPLIAVIHGVLPGEVAGQKEKGPSGVFKKTVVLGQLESGPVAEQVAPAIVDLLPEHGLALGRTFPPFRQAASAKVIHDTSWANAQFAALSNLPAIIPVVGNLIAATADFLVLTRNQIMLLLKLAAIYGRDLQNQRGILREILPVVGAALIWRTAARELAALLPGLLGAVPKILIAFAGTYAVGQAASYYYDEGHKPSARMVRSFYARASERASQLLPSLRPNRPLVRRQQ